MVIGVESTIGRDFDLTANMNWCLISRQLTTWLKVCVRPYSYTASNTRLNNCITIKMDTLSEFHRASLFVLIDKDAIVDVNTWP